MMQKYLVSGSANTHREALTQGGLTGCIICIQADGVKYDSQNNDIVFIALEYLVQKIMSIISYR